MNAKKNTAYAASLAARAHIAAQALHSMATPAQVAALRRLSYQQLQSLAKAVERLQRALHNALDQARKWIAHKGAMQAFALAVQSKHGRKELQEVSLLLQTSCESEIASGIIVCVLAASAHTAARTAMPSPANVALQQKRCIRTMPVMAAWCVYRCFHSVKQQQASERRFTMLCYVQRRVQTLYWTLTPKSLLLLPPWLLLLLLLGCCRQTTPSVRPPWTSHVS
jgi:hypothetical protein